MNIKVRLYTVLKKYGKRKLGDDGSLTAPEGMDLRGLTEYLDLPKRLSAKFLVNGSVRGPEYHLSEGDEVKIFASIGGG